VEAIDALDKKCEIWGLSAADREDQKKYEAELQKLIKEEEIKWVQRAKAIKLKDGNGNSKNFHQKENSRRRKKI
jgi:hypothetical protein